MGTLHVPHKRIKAHGRYAYARQRYNSDPTMRTNYNTGATLPAYEKGYRAVLRMRMIERHMTRLGL